MMAPLFCLLFDGKKKYHFLSTASNYANETVTRQIISELTPFTWIDQKNVFLTFLFLPLELWFYM